MRVAVAVLERLGLVFVADLEAVGADLREGLDGAEGAAEPLRDALGEREGEGAGVSVPEEELLPVADADAELEGVLVA